MNTQIVTSPSAIDLFYRDFELVELLDRILASCELPAELHDKALKHYEEKSKHLQKCPLLSRYDVVIKSQGSMSTGTTVPPVSKRRKAGEFDVDLLIAIEAHKHEMVPANLHKDIGAYLRSEYAKDLSAIRFGWQLDYAIEDRMHFDIVPAVREYHPEQGAILVVPDWDPNKWKPTNPEAYTRDFLALCEQLPIIERELAMLANSAREFSTKEARVPKVEALPAPSLMKRPLQRIVQLTKRHRDVWFSKQPDDGLKRRPASIVITTILWYAYQRYVANQRFTSVFAIFATMAEALTDQSILLRAEAAGALRYTLPNPTLPEENLVAKWNLEKNARAVSEFFAWAADYKRFIEALARAEGRHILQEKLSTSLGQEHVLPIFKAEAEARAPGSSTRSSFGYTPLLGITSIVSSPSAQPLKAHTYHGLH